MKNKAKQLLSASPRLKKTIKTIAGPYLRFQKKQAAQRYQQWLQLNSPSTEELSAQRLVEATLEYRPLISIVTPTYNTPEKYFIEMVQSVRAQTYTNWELVIVDDASPNAEVREFITEWANKDSRIRYAFLEKGLHIAGATNEAIKASKGEFVSLFDHDDTLEPNALFEIVTALNQNQSLNFIYTDEDKYLDTLGYRSDPFFKPDWNPDFLYSVNYITHFSTIRRSILDQTGYEDAAFNGAQDWELFLRIARSVPKETIHHIPKILYSWRVHESSTAQSLDAKPYVVEAQRRAIEEDLALQEKNPHYSLSRDPLYSGQWQLLFPTVNEVRSLYHLDAGWNTMIDADALKGDVTVFYADDKDLIDDSIQISVGDALRAHIGMVVVGMNSEEVAKASIEKLLIPQIAEYLHSEANTLSGHYYRTTRYSHPDIRAAKVLLVETAKAREILARNGNVTLIELSEKLEETGYRHLYNPYIKR